MSAMRSRRKVVGERLCRGPFGHEFPAAVHGERVVELPGGWLNIEISYGPPQERCRCGRMIYRQDPWVPPSLPSVPPS